MQKIKKNFRMRVLYLLVLTIFCFSNASIANELPDSVSQAINQSNISSEQLSASVIAIDDGDLALAWRDNKQVSPASTAKIITTLMGLEILGPHWRWKTQFIAHGHIKKGILNGNLVIIGGGNPGYVIEDLWRDLWILKMRGLKKITGDIIIDRSLFAKLPSSIAFDSESRRPYTKEADSALLNYQSVTFSITPNQNTGLATVAAMTPINKLKAPRTIKLDTANPKCIQWRQRMAVDAHKEWQPHFMGKFPADCPEKFFSYTIDNANDYWQSTLATLMPQAGIDFKGKVRSGVAPEAQQVLLVSDSDDLATVTRTTNKFSNNVTARHIFLTTGLVASGQKQGATYTMARTTLDAWLKNIGIEDPVYLENGSGLSRFSSVTARAMTAILRYGVTHPRGNEWISSLPIAGFDGTMKKREAAMGHAYIKTGLLNNVKTIAGIVYAKSGKRYAIFASLLGPGATEAEQVHDALIDWVYTEG